MAGPTPLERDLVSLQGGRAQLTSATATGAADLPDISRREPAAQRVESAIATRAALLINLSATGRWVLTISRTLAIEKVHSEHVHSATLVNAAGASAEDGSFFLGPSLQKRFVVKATTSHGSPGHPSKASFGEGATSRTLGWLENTPFFLDIKPQGPGRC